ncbi:MAG: cellulase family glycosylhydrolase [Lachnospiraceae bacterium]|nr:cellulase family glycosylhydrolase [Lachnospiraceae bacterium]
MKNRFVARIITFIVILTLAASWAFPLSAKAGEDSASVARPSADGQLAVNGTKLVNERGDTAVLQGVSTHGLTWYPEYVNDDLFAQVSKEWNANLVRLAMYSKEYVARREESLSTLHRGIEAGKKADQYVLVDWHILEDNDPNIYIEEAKAFFESISAEYAGDPHILYEICNEPNSGTTWDDIRAYAEEIIPIIRSHSPEAVIIVGTPDYDRDLSGPLSDSLSYENVMYTLHFYAGSHYDVLFDEFTKGIENGLPVFITECGLSEESGDGKVDYQNAAKWFTAMREHDVSFAVWNLSNKMESSSFIRASSGASKTLAESDLTATGRWVRALLQGEDPASIPQEEAETYSFAERLLAMAQSANRDGMKAVSKWGYIAAGCALLLAAVAGLLYAHIRGLKTDCKTYDDVISRYGEADPGESGALFKSILIGLLMLSSLIYLYWRLFYSINTSHGPLPIVCNVALLVVEVIGFIESAIHYINLVRLKKHRLPVIADEEYPDVDIFIATYNEPEELLYKTVNGCRHLKYPDKSKVHIWLCDDNRRANIRALAEKMGVGYFDRPDNEGAKAGNLNAAMARTSAPYVVTLDADMIVKSDFLLKTIPYFVYVEKCCEALPEEKKKHLGLLQTPQAFYDPDVFQYALYSERNIPNEQDFFYRTIEVGKATTNSVIYGGSNTVLSRKALEAVGGFYTKSITEDFATGLLIESAGFLSLALPEPLASGKTPNTFGEHIKQRTRWGRGVINTAKHLHLIGRKGLDLEQKLSYLSSVSYWFSPLKNLIYVLSPLFFAAFFIPVFRCSPLELIVFWFPMFVLQDLCLRVIGSNSMSLKWSAIYELSVMPYLLLPILKEAFGISLSTFQVTDKTKKKEVSRNTRWKTMAPFLVLLVLSLFGIIRVIAIMSVQNAVSMLIILFWLVRNFYTILMALCLIDGRDGTEDDDSAIVKAGEMASVTKEEKIQEDGITTRMTEHRVELLLDESRAIRTGDLIDIAIETGEYSVEMAGVVTGMRALRFSEHRLCEVEILDYKGCEDEYLQILYDRVPTLPQSLGRDFGYAALLWRNLVHRAMRTIH